MRTKRLAIVLVTLLGLGAACNKKEQEQAAPGTDPSSTAPVPTDAPADTPKPAEPAATPAGAPTVKVLSPGSAPLTQLRFKVAPGTTQTMEMTMKMAMDIEVNGQKPPSADIPAMKMSMDTKVTEITPGGDIRYEFVMGKADVVDEGAQKAIVDAMRASLKGLEGLKGHAVVSDRGITKEANVEAPATADLASKQAIDSMKQSMNQLSAPFPEEPVGVGSKWEVASILEQNGIKIRQTATYELVELKGNTGKTNVTIIQTADRQNVTTPGMPPGAKVEVLSLESKGQGTMSFMLDKLVPSLANMKLSSDMKMKADAMGQKQDMHMKMTLDLKVVGK